MYKISGDPAQIEVLADSAQFLDTPSRILTLIKDYR